MDENSKPTFDAWCIVEIFGHQQIAGRVTEQVIAGQGFVRVDVPDMPDMKGFTRMFGTGAIYSIIPTTEEVVRAFAARNVTAPIREFQLERPQIPAQVDDEDYDEDADGRDLPF